MTVTLWEEDLIENLDAAVSNIKERHELRLAAKRSQVAGFRETLTKKFPDKFEELTGARPISVAEHRKALRSALERNLKNLIGAGLSCFTLTCDTDPQDELGNPEDESGSYMARLRYCQALLNLGGIKDVLVFDRGTYGVLVVVI
jgi:hypothetical protein